ncbi:HXXXD-type acyl-transferase family protein [Prunus dulcis]|uniref:HXXXD-type acyl-transferase family protein n=1 Tax=Prunus dulcis TaxID=3755 RepID=A0A4Y1RR20_PRUDU|nr:HXXXD-type acyl-transferase family protein [Prunus dulcis]
MSVRSAIRTTLGTSPDFGIYYKHHQVKVARGVGYPACRQAPYVALVVPAYGEICDMMLRSRVA